MWLFLTHWDHVHVYLKSHKSRKLAARIIYIVTARGPTDVLIRKLYQCEVVILKIYSKNIISKWSYCTDYIYYRLYTCLTDFNVVGEMISYEFARRHQVFK